MSYDPYRALGHPCRREILTALRSGEQTLGALCARFELTRPAVAKHVALLERAGWVEGDWHGREHRYRLVAGPSRAMVAWLGQLTRPEARAVGIVETLRSRRAAAVVPAATAPTDSPTDRAQVRSLEPAGRVEPEGEGGAAVPGEWQVW